MAPPLAQTTARTAPASGVRKRGAGGRITHWLGHMGLPGATAVLVAVAVVLAELALFALTAIRARAFGVASALDVAAVTIVVATPIIVYAQFVIRQLGASRRALRQVTERLAIAVDVAERANQAKSQLLASMSHELRTPLNAIIGFAELIQAQTLGPIGHQRYLEYLADIGQAGHHLLRVINDILDMSKIEAGRADMRDEEEFNLAALIDATVRMMRPLAERQNVALETAADLRGVRVLAVERMICQILLNLLSNAVKFTPAGGRVDVAAAASAEGGLIVAVSDTGLGMTPDEILIALTPFGQVGNAMSRKHAGTGLGLPLAKTMMELHGGSLTVASAPGKGTTISLTFPPARVVRIEPESGAAAPGQAPAERRADGQRAA